MAFVISSHFIQEENNENSKTYAHYVNGCASALYRNDIWPCKLCNIVTGGGVSFCGFTFRSVEAAAPANSKLTIGQKLTLHSICAIICLCFFIRHDTFDVEKLSIRVKGLFTKGGILLNDDKIVQLYWDRSENAIEETAASYGRYLFTIAMRILSSESDSEECVNDTYDRVWHSIPPHRPRVLSAFLGRITRNLALNRLAARNAQKSIPSGALVLLDELSEIAADVSDTADDCALRDSINAFLGALPQRSRIVFMQRYWYAMSLKEIARHNGMSENAVKSLLARTRKSLRESLADAGIEV